MLVFLFFLLCMCRLHSFFQFCSCIGKLCSFRVFISHAPISVSCLAEYYFADVVGNVSNKDQNLFTHCIPLHELNCIDYGWNIVSNKVEIVGTFLS